MNAIEILRAASRSVPNEDYVQFMAAVDAVAAVIEAAKDMQNVAGVSLDQHPRFCRLHDALANVGGP